MLHRKTIYFIVIFCLSTALSISGEEIHISHGKKVYKEYCRVCHGDNGAGNTFIKYAVKIPPADFTSDTTIKKLTIGRMKMSIYYGRPSTAMVAWKNNLNERQINDVIAFIRYKFMKLPNKMESIKNVNLDSISSILTETTAEKIVSGEIIYKEFCFQCHGLYGDGDMPVKSALLYPPRNFTDPAVVDTLDINQMFYGIKNGINGTGMPSWKYNLTDEQIADVIVYIKETFMSGRGQVLKN